MTTARPAKAQQLKDQADKLASALLSLRNTRCDLAMRDDRVYISQEKLPGFRNALFDGGARFDNSGNLRNLGLRHNSGGGGSVELVVRNKGTRISIVHKNTSRLRAETVVTTAVFSTNGRLLKFREAVQR